MVQIYEHDHKAAALFPHLINHLPHSISLLRRIQHAITHPASTAKILASFPPSSAPDPNLPWLAARVDLFRGRETQIILYSSLEAEHTSIQPIPPPVTPGNPGSSPSSTTPESTSSNNNSIPSPNYVVATFPTADHTHLDLAREQFLALLAYVKSNLLPEYLASLPDTSGSASADPQSSNGVSLIPAPDPRAFLIGTLHTGLFSLLLRDGVFPSSGADESAAPTLPGLKVHRFDNPPYSKFLFRRENFTASDDGVENPLPKGYRFHDRKGRTGVLDSHLDLVQSRTHIPRSRAQLSVMPGVAIYYDSEDADAAVNEDGDELPIAWAFLGLDGALATLYVESEHRGKGLALPLSKEAMRKGMDHNGVFGAGGHGLDEKLVKQSEDLVHTEVAQYNQASRRVMEKIGGEVFSLIMWTVLELL